MQIRSARIVPFANESHGANARTAWAARPGYWLVLTDDEGRTGIGEASPLPGHSPESAAEAGAVLVTVCTALCDGVPVDATSPDRWLDARAVAWHRSPAARFAAETALLDLLGQRMEVPLAALLAPGGAVRERIPVNAVFDASLGLDALVDRVHASYARGIRVVKLKVGREGRFDDELRVLTALRRQCGPGLELRLDANGAFGALAHDRLAALAPLAPAFVEEPCSGRALLALGRTAVPWAVDESLNDPFVAAHFDAVEGCAAVVLKPAIVGGLYAARALAARARATGGRIGAVVTHLFDGPVGFSAACALAFSLGDELLPSGLAHYDPLERHGLPFVPDGVDGWRSRGAPGLGLRASLRRRIAG